jgi:type I restriction enzyme S subunit
VRTRSVQLGEVCEFIRGITFPSGEGKSAPFDNSVACLTTSGVQQEVAWQSRRFVQRSRVSRENQMLQAGDILISTANSKELVGKSCLVHRTPFPCTFGAFVTTARPKEAIYPPYLAYWMATRRFLAWCFQRSSNTTNISNLRVSELEDLELDLPSLSDQQRIAGQLEQADRLRRTRRYALELSDTFLPAAFLQLFGATGGNFPQSTVEDLAADKPHAIRTGPFGSQLLHSEFTDSGIVVLGIDNAVNNRFLWDERRYITPEKYGQLKRYTVFPGDVIITIMGTCGRCAIVPDGIPTAINTKHLCCITLDRKRCLPIYLHGAFLNHPFIRHQLHAATKGAIMEGLNMEIIKGLRIPLPPLPIQQDFAALVARHERLRGVQRESLRQSEHLFASLLHTAFATG